MLQNKTKVVQFADCVPEDYIPTTRQRVHEGIANSGGNGYNDSMNERVAKIEARLDGIDIQLSDIKADMRGLRWWIAGSVLVMLAGVVAFGAYQAAWFQHSISQSEKRIEDNRRETDRVIARIDEEAKKAEARSSEAYIKAEAIRLATEWQKQSAPAPAPPPPSK